MCAASFAEKEGTFTNTERRVQRVRQALPPRGDSRPDWRITCQIAQKMGAAGFDFSDSEEIMRELSSVTPQYAGIDYERIEWNGLQWPCTAPDHLGTPFLYAGKFSTASGKAQFKPLEYRPPAEDPDEEYPLLLTTDRSLYHFHTSSMSGRVEENKRTNRVLNTQNEGRVVSVNIVRRKAAQPTVRSWT